MAEKTLEEKIKDIIFYAVVFFILYLIIGFLIKSEWLSNHDESWIYSYELLRDGLTLTAYFLAPVAAFVLFVNWKDEHRAKDNERLSTEIKLTLYEAYMQIASYTSIDKPQIMGERQRQFENHLNKTKRLIEDIYTLDDESKLFKSNGKDLLKLLEQGQISWSKWVNNRISVSIINKAGNVQSNFDDALCEQYSKINNEILLKLNQLTVLKV